MYIVISRASTKTPTQSCVFKDTIPKSKWSIKNVCVTQEGERETEQRETEEKTSNNMAELSPQRSILQRSIV